MPRINELLKLCDEAATGSRTFSPDEARSILLLLKGAREALEAWQNAHHLQTLVAAGDLAADALRAIDEWEKT